MPPFPTDGANVEGVTSTIPIWMEIRGFMKEEGVGGLLGWAKGQGVPLLGRLYYSAKQRLQSAYNSDEIYFCSRVVILPTTAPSRALYMQPGLGRRTRVGFELLRTLPCRSSFPMWASVMFPNQGLRTPCAAHPPEPPVMGFTR